MKRFTDQELLDLLDDVESDRVERKRSFKGDTPARARQAVCGFANDLPGSNEPGVLFIGANDDGTPSHEPITDQTLRSLADIRSDGNILPLPAMSVEKRALKGAEMAVVTVMPCDMPPVKYDGRIWIRTGPRRAVANAQEERILSEKRRYKDIPYDISPQPQATLSDLSRPLFEHEYLPAAFAPDILKENNRTYEERLAACVMIVSPTDTTPTLLGLLTLCREPQYYIPDAYIQFLRLGGTELYAPVLDEMKIVGPIAEMLRRAEDKMTAHNMVAVNFPTGSTHVEVSDYPLIALKQILYNAVFHRSYEKTGAPVRVHWYDDRVEIISSGGPYGDVTPKNFGQPGIVSYRNPNIGSVLKAYKFTQSFGRGIMMARNEMERNGNPPIEFETDKGIVRCVLRKNNVPADTT